MGAECGLDLRKATVKQLYSYDFVSFVQNTVLKEFCHRASSTIFALAVAPSKESFFALDSEVYESQNCQRENFM